MSQTDVGEWIDEEMGTFFHNLGWLWVINATKEKYMTDTTALKSMLNNLINDKKEEATLDLHNYLTSKMREISGVKEADKLHRVEINQDQQSM